MLPPLSALSTASTLNVFVPTVPVSIDAPAGTVPVQRLMPVPLASSSQANAASTSWPCWNVAPSAGVEIEMLGAALSRAAVRVPLTQIPVSYTHLTLPTTPYV